MKPQILFVYLIVLILLRIGVICQLELAPDEAYYWTWSRHLEGGYLDHPPMVAILIKLTTWLGHNTEFWVRLPALLLGLSLSVLSYFFAKSLFKDKKAGMMSVFWINTILIFSLGFVVITPDTPLVFFSALTLFFLHRAIFERNSESWYCSGLAFGCALLSKYTAFLLIPCLIIFLYFSSNYKNLLKSEKPLYALLIALVVFSPALIWNATHHWASFQFQVLHGFSGTTIIPVLGFMEFLGGQVLAITPFVFVALMIAMVYCYRVWLTNKDDRFLFLFSFSAPILLFFLVLSFKTKIEGNWPVIAYFPSILALSGMVYLRQKSEGPFGRKINAFIEKGAGITVIIVFFIAHLQALFQIFPLSPQLDLTLKRTHGWKLLGRYVGKYYHNSSERNDWFVFAHRHNIVSEIAFYLPGQPEVFRTHGARRYSFFGNIDYLVGKNGLYVIQEDREELSELPLHFSSIEELPPLLIQAKGKIIRTFRLFRCLNYKGGLIEV